MATFVHTGADAADQGTLAGVLDVDAVVAAIPTLAGRISPSLCGSNFDGFEAEVRRAEDILSDGENAPGVACDAISVGIGGA